MASVPITSWQIEGETVTDFIFWAPKSLQMVTAARKLKDACSLGKRKKKKTMTNLEGILKKQRHYFANKGPSTQDYDLYSGHVWM